MINDPQAAQTAEAIIKANIKAAMESVGDLDSGLAVRLAAVDAIYDTVIDYMKKADDQVWEAVAEQIEALRVEKLETVIRNKALTALLDDAKGFLVAYQRDEARTGAPQLIERIEKALNPLMSVDSGTGEIKYHVEYIPVDKGKK